MIKSIPTIVFTVFLIALVFSLAQAGFIDFEEGTDGQSIASTLPELQFTSSGQHPWVYGLWSSGNYNGAYPDGAFHSTGDAFAWLGPARDKGTITFVQARATYFTLGYSAQYGLVLEAFDDTGQLLDTQTGLPNLDSGQMDTLTVTGAAIAWVVIREESGFGNYWVIDDIETDAVSICEFDAHCDDGKYCNGLEICEDYICVPAQSGPCTEDGLWCNGAETCDEEHQACLSEFGKGNLRCVDDGDYCNGQEACSEDQDQCLSSGNPCPPGETCDETTDQCREEEEETTPEEEDKDLWPEGKVTGGCCGCE